MPRYRAYGSVVGTKYLGEFEAESEEEAEDLARKDARVYLCHHCNKQCECPEIQDITIEPVKQTKAPNRKS